MKVLESVGCHFHHATSTRETPSKEEDVLCFCGFSLEKAFDRVPREVGRWALRNMGVYKTSLLTQGPLTD